MSLWLLLQLLWLKWQLSATGQIIGAIFTILMMNKWVYSWRGHHSCLEVIALFALCRKGLCLSKCYLRILFKANTNGALGHRIFFAVVINSLMMMAQQVSTNGALITSSILGSFLHLEIAISAPLTAGFFSVKIRLQNPTLI